MNTVSLKVLFDIHKFPSSIKASITHSESLKALQSLQKKTIITVRRLGF